MSILKYLVALLVVLLSPVSALAQAQFLTTNGQPVEGMVGMCIVANRAVPCSSGGGGSVTVSNLNPNGQTSMANSSPMAIASDQTPLPVVGNVAAGTTDSGNGVKVAGLVNTTAPTSLVTGQRQDLWLGAKGNVGAFLYNQAGTAAVLVSPPNATVGVSNNGLEVLSATYAFDGTNLVRVLGSATGGMFTMPGGHSFSNITTATTTLVKSGAGVLHTVCVNTPAATATIQMYDSLTATGTKIGLITATVAGCQLYDIAFATGLTVVTATAAPDITVSYR